MPTPKKDLKPGELSDIKRKAVSNRWKNPKARQRQSQILKDAWDARRRAIAAAEEAQA